MFLPTFPWYFHSTTEIEKVLSDWATTCITLNNLHEDNKYWLRVLCAELCTRHCQRQKMLKLSLHLPKEQWKDQEISDRGYLSPKLFSFQQHLKSLKSVAQREQNALLKKSSESFPRKKEEQCGSFQKENRHGLCPVMEGWPSVRGRTWGCPGEVRMLPGPPQRGGALALTGPARPGKPEHLLFKLWTNISHSFKQWWD